MPPSFRANGSEEGDGYATPASWSPSADGASRYRTPLGAPDDDPHTSQENGCNIRAHSSSRQGSYQMCSLRSGDTETRVLTRTVTRRKPPSLQGVRIGGVLGGRPPLRSMHVYGSIRACNRTPWKRHSPCSPPKQSVMPGVHGQRTTSVR